MLYLTVLLNSDEWFQIHQAAIKQWPTETLSQTEIMRRLALAGSRALAPPGAAAKTIPKSEI